MDDDDDDKNWLQKKVDDTRTRIIQSAVPQKVDWYLFGLVIDI